METEVGPEQPSDMSRLRRSPVPFSVCRALSLSVRHSPSIRLRRGKGVNEGKNDRTASRNRMRRDGETDDKRRPDTVGNKTMNPGTWNPRSYCRYGPISLVSFSRLTLTLHSGLSALRLATGSFTTFITLLHPLSEATGGPSGRREMSEGDERRDEPSP